MDEALVYPAEWWRRQCSEVAQWESWLAPHRCAIPLAVDRLRARSVFEIGCGAGANLRLLRETRPTVTVAGSDLNDRFVAHARRAGFAVSETAIPHAVTGYDAVLSCYAMAYCTRYDTLLALQAIETPYLILIEPMGAETIVGGGTQQCARIYHDWPSLLAHRGWTLCEQWPLPAVDGITTMMMATH